MRIPIIMVLVLFTVHVTGQAVNETIKLQLSQSPVLRVNVGNDLNLAESGLVMLGESVNVSGGTPEFSYEWYDTHGNEYYGKTQEVSETGSYWLTVTDQNNCTSVDSLTVSDYGVGLLQAYGISENQIIVDHIYKTITIKLPDASGKVYLSVVTTDGKIVYSHLEANVVKQFSHKADLSQTANGIYLVVMEYNNKRWVDKFILQ